MKTKHTVAKARDAASHASAIDAHASHAKDGRIVIDNVEIELATPPGKPKHRSAAAIRAAVRAHFAKTK